MMFDKDGYLIEKENWSKELAEEVANDNGITLSEEHWFVIQYFRDFYLKHETTPTMRKLITELKNHFSDEKFNSMYIDELFKGEAAKTISKLAGLPKPKRCI